MTVQRSDYATRSQPNFWFPQTHWTNFLSKNDANLNDVSTYFKVSIIVAARRMLDTEVDEPDGL